MTRIRLAAASLAVTAVAVAPAGAGASIQVGANFAANSAMGNCGDVYTVLQTQSPNNSYAAPADGVITSWTFQSDTIAPPWSLKLIVARAAGGDQYTTVGKSPVQSPVVNVPNTYSDVRIPVRAGDVLGYFSIAANDPTWCGRAPQAGFEASGAPNEPDLGSTRSYMASPFPAQLNISATLEPDCDGDGFGDETQDSDLTPCDRVAPDTTITKGPKDRTRKKSATFEFTGSDARVLAGFECALDGATFATCTSPHTVRVKKGRHTFSVRATDTNANVDGAPATDDWKVKKKERKK